MLAAPIESTELTPSSRDTSAPPTFCEVLPASAAVVSAVALDDNGVDARASVDCSRVVVAVSTLTSDSVDCRACVSLDVMCAGAVWGACVAVELGDAGASVVVGALGTVALASTVTPCSGFDGSKTPPYHTLQLCQSGASERIPAGSVMMGA